MRYVLLLVVTGALLLGACGGDDDGGDGGDATASPTSAATEAAPTRTASATSTAAGTPAADCAPRRELTADEQQPSSDPGSTQGTILDVDEADGTIYIEPSTGAASQVQYTDDTRFVFSDGNEASADDLECGAEVAAAGTHELRGSLVAELVGIIVPPADPPDADLCPIGADACSFASQIAQNVLEGDGDAVMSSSKSTFYECPGPNSSGAGQPLPLCEGAPAGEMRAGFPFTTTFQGEGSVVTEADAARIISEWRARADASLSDEFGDGEARAYSIACADVRLDEGSSCGDEFSLIFSGLTPGASSGESLGRWMLVVFVHRDEGELRAYRFASGVLGFGLEYPLQGGTGLTFDQNVPRILAPMPEAGAAFVTFFPWDPSALIQ